MKRYSIVLIIICTIFAGCKKDKAPVVKILEIGYPTAENSLLNVLSDTLTQITAGVKYCVAANLPKGTSLQVIIKPSSGHNSSGIGIDQMTNNGWTVISADSNDMCLQAKGSGQTVSISFMTGPPTSVDFFVYENDSVAPIKIRTLKNY